MSENESFDEKKVIKKKKVSINRKLKHKIFRVRNIFSILSLILVILLTLFINDIDVLPMKYSILIYSILIIVNLIGIIFINVHKKIILKILGWLIITLSIGGSICGIYYLNSTNKFINSSFKTKELITKNTYYVLGRKDANLKENDITGNIGLYKETVNKDNALKKLSSKYPLTPVEYADVGELFNNLNTGTIKLALMEKASYEIIFSIDSTIKREDFEIIYEFDTFTTKKRSSNTNYDKFNIFIGGTDFTGLMDFNMIISINMSTHEAILTSIPRDYYIDVAGKNGKDKLSFMSAYGPNVNKDSLAQLFGIQIDYTLLVNTTSLVTIVDHVGGIEFCSDYAYTTTHALVNNTYDDRGRKLKVIKGCQHLNGIETLTVARERNAFPGRDRVRQENCQKIIIAIIKKLISTDTILHYNETLNTLGSLYETDLPREIVTSFAKDILNNGNRWNITTQSVDGIDGKDKVHLSNVIDWVMYPYEESVLKAKENIQKILK